MVYDRTHTRNLTDLEQMRLYKTMPFAAFTFVIAGLASMGLPGFSGFVAELQVLIGAWNAYPTFAVIAGAGILVGVAFTIRTIQSAFFSGESMLTRSPASPALIHPAQNPGELDPISVPEQIKAILLMAISLIVGLQPRLLLDLIQPALASPLFEHLLKRAGS
jgi:NADH-quinone oxidoreductase subunit M